jgi:hypothetical protein
MGMALVVSGRMADKRCKLRHDPSNHSEPNGQMDGKRQELRPAEPPDLVYCPNVHKEDDHILFGDGGGAGLLGRQVVLYPWLAAAAPADQSITTSSAAVGPSLVYQLRARAHCHQRSQLKGGSLCEFHRGQLPRL